MSDYFGALIRSSGLTIADRTPPTAQHRPDISTPVDIDVESGTERAATAPPKAGTQPQAATTLEASDSARQERRPQPSPVPAERATGDPRHPVAPESDAANKVRPHRGSESTPGEEPTQPADAPSALLHPVLGQIAIRAAMRWVAAEPGDDRAQRAAVSMITPPTQQLSPPIAREPAHERASPALRDETPLAAPPGIPRPIRAAAPEAVDAHAPVPTAAPERLARPAVVRADPIAAPILHDEPVEISIGAIHVRVDAAPAQTVARTPAPPAAAQPRSHDGRPRERSGLGRRALRRI